MFKKNYKNFVLVFVLGMASVSAVVLLSLSECQCLRHTRKQALTGFISQELKKEAQVKIFLVGDIMLDRGVEWYVKQNNDWRFPFLKIADELKKADLVFGNLEGPISDKGKRVGSIYSFRADPKVIEGLAYAGFDILSLANNHMLDYQRVALEDTMARLEENGIDYVGAGSNREEAFSVKIKEIKGTKIGFLGYTNLGPEVWSAGEGYAGVAWISWDDMERVKEDIKRAKEKVDVLVVSLHAGQEYSEEPTVFQKSFSQNLIEAGADLVVGHHPHVVQQFIKHKHGWIAYSLGNFVFDQGFSEETMRGRLLKVIIENKKIKQVIPVKIQLNQFFQPEIL